MFEALVSSIDEVLHRGPSPHPCGPAMQTLQRQRNRLDYATACEVAAFDTDKAWSPDGAYNAAAWLAAKLRIPRGEAQRLVRVGRALRDMPHVDTAFAAGALTLAHADALAVLRRPSTVEAFTRDEAWLVEQATTLTYKQFRCVTHTWDDTADPQRAEAKAKKLDDDRAVHLSQSYEGAWFLDGTLDPIGGLAVSDELRRLEHKEFRKDWKAAKKRLGRKPRLEDLQRNATQRRADALVEMARRSRAMPKDARKPEPLFTAIVGVDGLKNIIELHNRTRVHPSSTMRWLPDAWVERVVFGPKSRPIDIGRRRRLFTAAQKRAIQVPDRECTHDYCDRPATECETDHIEPYAQGGETTETNGRSLCRYHNQLRNTPPHPPPDNTDNTSGNDTDNTDDTDPPPDNTDNTDDGPAP
jgi:hypothetical protein